MKIISIYDYPKAAANNPTIPVPDPISITDFLEIDLLKFCRLSKYFDRAIPESQTTQPSSPTEYWCIFNSLPRLSILISLTNSESLKIADILQRANEVKLLRRLSYYHLY